MSSTIYPNCTRAIDPYSSYNSNVVNILHRMVTRGENILHSGANGLDIISDSTSPSTSLILTPGICYIDDVMNQITDDFNIDMSCGAFYVDTSSGWWNEAGYYYITIYYKYEKQYPPPRAKIQIFKPSQRNLKTNNYLFLKCIKVIFNGSSFEIASLHDEDPENPSVNRCFSKIYVGTEPTLPIFDAERDESRIIYVKNKDELFFGTNSRWESFSAVRDNITTSACDIGQLAYIDIDGTVKPAIATSISTFSDCAVLQVGSEESGSGKVRLSGLVNNVPIESNNTINIGDKLYLSSKEAGKVSNMISAPFSQLVGVCKYIDSTSSTTCDIWFYPTNSNGSENLSAESLYDRYQDLLLGSVFKRLFVDTFHNTDYIDLALTTASLNVSNFEIVGTNGEVFVSNSLTDPGYDGTCIISCQVSCESTNQSDISWYASNDGGNVWEPIDLDEIHTFSTIQIPIILDSGSLEVGEWVEGSISGKMGVVRVFDENNLFLSDVTETSSNWSIGEALIGKTSGGTVTISDSIISRNQNCDLRVLAYFNGSASIQDYGVIYDVDTKIDETSRNNELNIDTLYADMYEIPSINNDGLRCYPFLDSTAILILNVVERNDTITKAIVRLDNNISEVRGVGQFNVDDTTPSISENYSIWKTSDSTSVLTITNFDDAYEGQKVEIVCLSENVIIQNNENIHLAGETNYEMKPYDTLFLRYVDKLIGFVEISRSNNN